MNAHKTSLGGAGDVQVVRADQRWTRLRPDVMRVGSAFGAVLGGLTIVFVLAAGSPVLADPGPVSALSRFEQGTDGWQVEIGGVLSWSVSGGYPLGGCIRTQDTDPESSMYIRAPQRYCGDWTALDGVGIVRLDVRFGGDPDEYPVAGYPQVDIEGPGGKAFHQFAVLPTSSWRTYETTLQESAWTVLDGTWAALLADVREVTVLSDFTQGRDVNYFDNIFVGVPGDCNSNSIPDVEEIIEYYWMELDCNNDGIVDECSGDCNSNGAWDAVDICDGTSLDCNGNKVPDECDLAAGTSPDCNGDLVPDECSGDCNSNGFWDACDIYWWWSQDCQPNGVPDECEIAGGTSPDCDQNWVPDECSGDCNTNGEWDACDIFWGWSLDCQPNGVPDECEVAGGTSPDCNSNTIPDECDIASGSSRDCQPSGVPDECEVAAGTSPDCNGNTLPDECDIAFGTSPDCDDNAVPDECDLAAGDPDCNGNAVPDHCDLTGGTSADCNGNAVPDECDIAAGTSVDCQPNGVPDECELGGYNNCCLTGHGAGCSDDTVSSCVCGSPGRDLYCCLVEWDALCVEEVESLGCGNCLEAQGNDCNSNAVPDECDIAAGTSLDCQSNGIPDECAEADCNTNGLPDQCDIAAGSSRDCQFNGKPDECEPDCNADGLADDCAIAGGTSPDCDGDGLPDDCGPDANTNGTADACELVKWPQPPKQQPGDAGWWEGWGETSVRGRAQIVADDWPCLDGRAVSGVRWWGTYQDWTNVLPPHYAPTDFSIGVWSHDPSGGHPDTLLVSWLVPRADLGEHAIGRTQSSGHDDATLFAYEFAIPPGQWFTQQPGTQSVYWLSVAGVYGTDLVCACMADVNTNGIVNAVDVIYVRSREGCLVYPGDPDCTRCDVNCDGVVDTFDVEAVKCQVSPIPRPPDPVCCVRYPWGWQTRRPVSQDGGVRIIDPTAPLVGDSYIAGEPIADPPDGWDLAFVLESNAVAEPRACCLADQSCLEVLPWECVQAHAGEPQEEGERCAELPCIPWVDCNTNGIHDILDLANCPPGDPACADCNTNGVLDECDIAGGTSVDADADGVPDECDECVGAPGGGDADSNGFIDLSDLAALVDCLTGPLGDIGSACGPVDMDGDCDVDLYDFALWQEAFTGSGPPTGLRAWWSLNENGGGVAHDVSGHGFHGTVQRADWVEGMAGSALQFFSTDIVTGISAGVDDTFGGGFSISVWLNWSGGSGTYYIMDARSSDLQRGFILWVPSGTQVGIYLYKPGGVQSVFSTSSMPVGSWVHVVAVYDAAAQTLRMYFNGAPENTVPATAPYTSTDLTAAIGNNRWAPDDGVWRPFNGRIDELRLYDRALQPTEVTWLLNEPSLGGACCAPGGTCADAIPGTGCRGSGYRYQGAGTECLTVTCPQPQACCLADGSCQDRAAEDCVALGGVPSGTGTTCATTSCPQPQACCHPNGSCDERTAGACAASGGTAQGEGTTCATTLCPPIPACCDAYGGCQQLSPDECLAQGGEPQGEWTDCATTGCPGLEACCDAFGGCSEIAPFGCLAQGGEPQGAGTDCATTGCPPLEACCDQFGGCFDIEPFACLAQEGVPQGPGSECGLIQCPMPEACCYPNGTCLDVIPSTCTAQNGDPQGPGTYCYGMQCALPEACCLGDGSCVDVAPWSCLAQGGTAQGSGTECWYTYCPEPEACCYPDGSCLDRPWNACMSSNGVPQGAGTTCATIPPCPVTPVNIFEVRSLATHGALGTLRLYVSPGQIFESRDEGVHLLEVLFDQPMDEASCENPANLAISGVVHPNPTVAVTLTLDPAGTMLQIQLAAALPNVDCYTFDLTGMVGADGAPLGNPVFHVGALLGDATRDGIVDWADAMACAQHAGQAPSEAAGTVAMDCASDGMIDSSDWAIIGGQSGAEAPTCPP